MVEVCYKVFAGIHLLKRLQYFLPVLIKLFLAKTPILPHFNCCNAVIDDVAVAQAEQLQTIQNDCIRFICDLRRDDRTMQFYVRSQIPTS